ncbi:MAG: phosphoribosylanthranilate isomerase [Clostridia bacterium]|nr:phosphoribosylanthranilate isomerase [Clostridia bacterium]
MTKIKLCGLTRTCDIEAVNELKPEYIGFVFVSDRRRYIPPEKALILKRQLDPNISAVGVFIDEKAETVADLLNRDIIDVAQLHGDEDEDYIARLRSLTDRPIIKAFQIKSEKELALAERCSADFVLLDSGTGTGKAFDWKLIGNLKRPYFLAGGLACDNVEGAIQILHPYAVDVSSGVETDGLKDKTKMAAFIAAVRKEDRI